MPCKKINFSQPQRSRKKGRPRLSWIDSVLKDLKTLEMKSSGRSRHTRGCREGGGGGGGGGEEDEEYLMKLTI